MDTRDDSHLAEGPLAFRTPEGLALETLAHVLRLQRVDGVLRSVTLDLELAPDVWATVDDAELFNLLGEVRGPSLTSFSDSAPVSVEIKLAEALLERAANWKSAEAGWQEIAALGGGAPDDPLVQTESWFALRAGQDVALPPGMPGSLSAGFTTLWNALPGEASTPPPTGPLMHVMLGTMVDNGFDVELVREGTLEAFCAGDNGEWTLHAVAREELEQVLVLSRLDDEVAEGRRREMAVLLARMNYGLAIGSFDLDFSDGEVRFRTSIDVENDRLSPALFQTLLDANIATFDRFLPSIEAVRQGGAAEKVADAWDRPDGRDRA